MRMGWRAVCATAFLLGMGLGPASATAADEPCGACHLPDISESIAAVQGSPHWNSDNPLAPGNGSGCRACHGESGKHVAAPTRLQPDVSFGPRWTSSISAQNGACLGCHSAGKLSGWPGGVHARQNLTCSNCHRGHALDDAGRIAHQQSEFCTVCHKVQKGGMHYLTEKLEQNPPCNTCHDPHADPHPHAVMLGNRSEGCRACHDLQQMVADGAASARASSYHKVMQSKDRTCIDCHSGVAHVDRDDFAAVLAGGFSSHSLTLFYPGQADSEWLLSEHPGSQSLRQGRNCRQCHLGDAQSMGEKLAPAGIPATMPIELAFARAGERMEVSISWSGDPNANDVAVMFSGDEVEEFARGGCWAACHGDMPGMARDQGLGLQKYLRATRAQARSVGRPPVIQDPATLAGMVQAGQYVELWRADLDQGALADLEVFRVLEKLDPAPEIPVSAAARYAAGRWTVTFSRALADPRKPIVPGKTYTLGVAVHGDGKSGAQHWVSLPVTVSLDGFDTDFVAK